MSDSSSPSAGAQLHPELQAVREQRDLYRSLLLSDPHELAAFLRQALGGIERLRALLRMPARDAAAFRSKLSDLRATTEALTQAALDLHLPTIEARLMSTRAALCELEAYDTLSGNDLLPVMVVIEELCCHLTIAADCAQLHLPEDADAARASGDEATASLTKLGLALQQLTDKVAAEHGKQVSLVTLGLEDMPSDWTGPLFDLLAALVRNAIEHGIEDPEQRAARGKAAQGTVVVELIDRHGDGFELHCNDDGSGLDAERITEVAVRRGLLEAEQARQLEPPRLVSLIFQPGVSTARDGARRGNGMQIVRGHVQRLDGRIQVATKRGQFTRINITLPPYGVDGDEQSLPKG